jgi:hypothetical protein
MGRRESSSLTPWLLPEMTPPVVEDITRWLDSHIPDHRRESVRRAVFKEIRRHRKWWRLFRRFVPVPHLDLKEILEKIVYCP